MPRKALFGLALVLVGFAVYLLYFHRLGTRDLWSSHEARAAMNAHSLLWGSGSPGVPSLFDGTPEVQKPPLYYALVAGVAAGWGAVDGMAVRLPATLAALATLALLGFWLGYVRGRPMLAMIAVTVLATGIHFTLLARTGRIDMPLTLTTLAACIGVIEAIGGAGQGRRRGWLLLAYVALAAGLLLKGPVALALVLAALLPWLLLEPRRSRVELLRRLEPWWGLPLLVVLVLPWLLWIDHATQGEFFRVFFWEHNLERGLGTGRLRTYPVWYYLPLMGVNFLPWSPLLAVAVFLALSRGWCRFDGELRLSLAALVGIFTLLSLAAFKRADYLAPLYPFAAVVVAVALERAVARWTEAPGERRGVSPPVLPATLCLVVLLLAGIGQAIYTHTELARVEPRRELASFARVIQDEAKPGEPVLQFRTECHLLAFHLGPGREIIVEWPDLADRVRRAGSLLVVMPRHLGEATLPVPDLIRERLADNGRAGHRHDRPLVLFRLRASESQPPCPSYLCSPRSPTNP